MEIDEATTLLRKLLGSGRATQLIEEQGLASSNFVIENITYISLGVGINKVKDGYRQSVSINIFFGYTRKNNPKKLSFSDIDFDKAEAIFEAWMVYSRDKAKKASVSDDLGF